MKTVTEGVYFFLWHTPPVTFGDSPLIEGAKVAIQKQKGTAIGGAFLHQMKFRKGNHLCSSILR